MSVVNIIYYVGVLFSVLKFLAVILLILCCIKFLKK